METITPYLLVIVLAFLGEAVITGLKPGLEPLVAWLNEKITVDLPYYMYLSYILGVTLALVYGADILFATGLVDSKTVFSTVLTGVLVGRGANFVYDFFVKRIMGTGDDGPG